MLHDRLHVIGSYDYTHLAQQMQWEMAHWALGCNL